MQLNQLSIQLKVTLLAGLCLLVVVCVLTGASLYQSASQAEEVRQHSTASLTTSAKQRLNALGQVQALRIQRFFASTHQYGESIAEQVLYLREQAQKRFVDPFDTREDLVSKLRSSLAANPGVLGVYLVFEKDALDAKDELFEDQADLGSNESGRFSVYWSRDNQGNLHAMALTEQMLSDTSAGTTGQPYNAWYTCPHSTGDACVLEPYYDEINGENLLMTGIAIPLRENGRIVAVLGLDISLSNLQQLSQQGSSELYEGQGEVSIASATGLLIGHSRQPDTLGKLLDAAYPEHAGELRALLGSTQSTSLDHGQTLREITPFLPIAQAKPWSVMLSMPTSVSLSDVESLSQLLETRRNQSTLLAIVVGAITALIGVLVIWLTALGVTRPILQVAATLKDIASGEGDLTRRLNYQRQDELGELSTWFNRFLDKLQPIVAEVKRSVIDARSTADRSAEIASQTSTAMQQQYREMDQVATAFQEMSATAHDVAHNASQAAAAARQVDQASREGREVVDATTESILDLANEVNQSMQEVEGLAASSEKIGSVLEVIRAIADQTNLLALNAAIEAARAGESGRGFAVVADEVRSLAKRTQDSVEEIRSVIEGLQAGTREVVSTMNSSQRQAQGSVGQVQQAVAALQRISEAVAVITDMNLQIASAAEQQSSVAEEINRNVASIRDVTESITRQADESAQISQSLNQLANQQQALMEQFRV